MVLLTTVDTKYIIKSQLTEWVAVMSGNKEKGKLPCDFKIGPVVLEKGDCMGFLEVVLKSHIVANLFPGLKEPYSGMIVDTYV